MTTFYVHAFAPRTALTDDEQEAMTLALPGTAVVSYDAAAGRVQARFTVEADTTLGAYRAGDAAAVPVLGEGTELNVSSAEHTRNW